MSDIPVCVLDISVLLYTPEALYDFPDKEVVLPICILEELDCIKLDQGEKGRSAQIITRMLDRCRQSGSLSEGVRLPNGSKLRIELLKPNSGSLPYSPDFKQISNKVLAVAWTLYQKNREVVFVSQDENLRTKSGILNVPTIYYQGNKLDDSVLYSGMHRYEVDKQKLHKLAKQSSISKEEVFFEHQQRE